MPYYLGVSSGTIWGESQSKMMCLKGQHWSAWSKLHLEHIIQIPAVFIKKAQGSLDELEVTILNHKIINNEWIKKKKNYKHDDDNEHSEACAQLFFPG